MAMRPSRSAAELIIPGAGTRPASSSLQPSSFRGTPRKGGPTGLASILQLEFGHASGDHGLQWDGTLVVKVADQAQKLGVRPGWKIHMIDGHVVNDGNDIWMRLQEAKWQWRSCHVSFVTDTAFIRAERAMARVAAIKAEEERLAKLAFEGSHDQAHVSQVVEEYPFQGYIDRPEDRGVTLEQLVRVLDWSKEKCHRWRDAGSSEDSSTSGMKLSLDFMNMHHLNHWLIKPATLEKGCSLVELLTNKRQPPTWCVIHCWSELLVDLLKCVMKQAAVRILPATAVWWVAAFAIRPHTAQDETFEPMKSRFWRAMSASHSRVLLILDSKKEQTGPATAVNRLWCAYELTMCLDQPNLSLDIVATQGTKPVFIMKGFTDEEEVLESRNPGSGYKAKTDREKVFGLDIIERCLDIRIQNGQTLVNADRSKILNFYASRELTLAPLQEHELYTKANKRLMGLFALVFWRRVMATTANDSHTQRLQLRTAEVLRNDLWRTHMDACLAFCVATAPEEKLALLVKSFPPGLRELKLDLKGLDIINESMAGLAGSLPRELEELVLDLSQNAQIDNLGITNFITALPPKQKGICLHLGGTAVSPEFQERRDSLEGLKQQIIYEAQKGSICNVLNLCPSPDRRVVTISSRTKI